MASLSQAKRVLAGGGGGGADSAIVQENGAKERSTGVSGREGEEGKRLEGKRG